MTSFQQNVNCNEFGTRETLWRIESERGKSQYGSQAKIFSRTEEKFWHHGSLRFSHLGWQKCIYNTQLPAGSTPCKVPAKIGNKMWELRCQYQLIHIAWGKEKKPWKIDVSRKDISTSIDARNETMHQDYESHKTNHIQKLDSIKTVLAFVRKYLDKKK